MRRILSDKKGKNALITLGIEILLFIILVMTLFIPSRKYVLTKDESITLPYGHYYLTCNYKISDETDNENYLYIYNDKGTSEGILTSENLLDYTKNTYNVEFWITKTKENINLIIGKIKDSHLSSESDYTNYEIERTLCLEDVNYEIQCTPYVKYIAILSLSILIAGTIICYLILENKIKLTKERIINVIILFVVFVVSCMPLTGDALIKGDDTIIHLVRLEGMKDGYLAGQFPVRVEPTINGGYGYAFSTYYGSLFFNIPVILRLMGFTIQAAYKSYIVVLNLATVIIAYYSFKIMFKKSRIALTGTIMYSLSLIRLVDLYQRDAVGEATALVFLPLIVAGLWKIYVTPVENENYKRLWIMPVIGYFGVIESHVLSTEIFGVFTILLCLLLFKKTFRKNTFIVLLKIVLITIVLNIGYLLPFIESYIGESTYISSELSNNTRLTFCLSFTDVFKFFYKFTENSLWRNYMAAGLGPTVIPVIALFIYRQIKGIDKYKKTIIVSGIITIIAVILSLDIFPYDSILTYLYNAPTSIAIINKIARKLSVMVINIQFAMRFITVGTCSYIVFTCALLSNCKEERLLKLSEILLAVITLIQFIWACVLTENEMEHINLYTISPTDKEITCQVGNAEYMPLTENGDFPYFVRFREIEGCYAVNAEIIEFHKNYTNIYVHVETGENVGLLELPLLYYRGYRAFDIDTGKEFTVYKNGGSAQLGVIVNENYDGTIKIYYAGKVSWHIAEIVSAITLISIVIYSIRKRENILQNNIEKKAESENE